MEAAPRMPMLSLEMKNSIEYVDFGPTLKQYIRDHYGEDPAHFNKACSELEQLRQTAVHISHDFMGCSTLKKYFSQLQFLQGRFPLTEGGEAAIPFTWEDVYTGREVTLADIKFEQASILYNIGALHSILGAMDTRQSADGMKVSCTHFQCATWAFEYLRDHFGSSAMSTDMCHEILTFHIQLMLAQAQECILEKSMTDSRKSTITAKVAAQIVEFYRTTIKHLEVCHSQDLMSSKRYKDCKKTLEIKVLFYICITNYYMGRDAEDQQKWGLCLAYYTLAKQKLEECMKMAKSDSSSDFHETLRFTNDVVVGKYEAAKKDNDFVYHDKIPALDTLPEVKGASLVKGIPFNPNDPEISGPDIFQKLVPMSAHEAASLYSEEKAKLLRKILAEIEEKNEHLTRYLSSLQLDSSKLNPEPERLPQQLLEKCAAISVRPNAIKDLIDAMGAVSNVATEVDIGIKETKQMLAEEEEKETEFQKMFGKRTRNLVLSEIEKECGMFEEGHKKGSQSNNDLHKAMNAHINNLRLLSGPLDDLQKALPSLDKEKSSEDEAIIKELQRLLTKVEEMKNQRCTLEEQFRKQVHEDDITNTIVTREGVNREVLFQEHLKKHEQTTNYIHQNLSAQDNILRALTDANAKYANIRRSSGETVARRETMIKELILSYDVYEDLLAKSQKGLEFYRKLESNITRLSERCQRVCKAQQDERDHVMARHKPKAPPPSRPSAPKPSSEVQDQVDTIMPPSSPVSMPVFDGPKLKDYLPFMKPRTFGKKDSAVDPKMQGYLPELGGSLPGSVTGSPIHLPTMPGSHPGTPLLSSRRGNSLPPDLSVPSSNATSSTGQQELGLDMRQYPGIDQPQSSHSPSPDTRQFPPQSREGNVPQSNVMPPTAQTPPLFMQPQNQQLPKQLPQNQQFPNQLPQQNMQVPQHLPANLQGQQIIPASGQQQMYQAQQQILQGGVVHQQEQGQILQGGVVQQQGQGQGAAQGQFKGHPQQLYQQQYVPTQYPTQQDGAGQQKPQQSNFPQQYASQTQPSSQQFAGQSQQLQGPTQQFQAQPQPVPQSFVPQRPNLPQSQQPPISMSQPPQVTQTQYQTPSSQSHQAYSQYQGDYAGHGSVGQPQIPQFATVSSSQYQPYSTTTGSQSVANNPPTPYSYNQSRQDTTNTVSTVSAPVISPGMDRRNHGHLSGQFSGQLPQQSGQLQGPQFQGSSQLPFSQTQQPQSILQQYSSQPQGQGQGQQPQYQGQQSQILHQYSSSMGQGQGSQLASQNLVYNQDQPYSQQMTPVSSYQRHPLNQMLSAHGSPSHALFNGQMQPVSSHQGRSVSSFETQPVLNYHSHSVSSYQEQPVSTYQAQPVSDYQTPPLTTYPTQPISSYQVQPVPIRLASQTTGSHDAGRKYGQSMGSPNTASVSASYSFPHGSSTDAYGQSSYLGAQQPVRPSQGVQVANQSTYGNPNQEPSPNPGQKPMTHHLQGPFSASQVQMPLAGSGYQQQQQQLAYQQQLMPQQQQLQQPSIQQPQFQQQGILTNVAQQTPVSVAMNKPQHVSSYPGQSQGFIEQTPSQQQPPAHQYAHGQVTQTVQVRPQQPSQQFQAQSCPPQSASYQGQGQMTSQGQQTPGVQQPVRQGVPGSYSNPADSQQIPKITQQPPLSQLAQSQSQFPRQPETPYSIPGSHTAQQGQTSHGQQMPNQGQFSMQMQLSGQPLPHQQMGLLSQQLQHHPQVVAQQPQPVAQQGFDQTSSQAGEPKLSSPLKPILVSKSSEPSPVHKPQQQTTSRESDQVSTSSIPPPSSTMSPQHAITSRQLSKLEQQHSNASSLDEILSSSPSEKSNTKMEDVLAPKVLTAQEIEQQKEEARKHLSLPQVPIDPYKQKDKLNKFVDEVEKLAKFIENMEKPTCSGSTPLDAVWKELMDAQERANRKQPMAIARCYPMKNREQDIMPYDDTRVVLTTQKDDYINASWINDLSPCCPKFIATQAPLLVTMQDFWAMVYEQGIEVLVMLTSENETGKKFPVYWPQQKGFNVEYGPFTLALQSVKDKQCWTERIIYLTHTETKVGRTIVHLLFNGWPVSGSPSKINLLPQFITEVHTFYRQQRSLMKPVLVHCSNGSGRTGTFMLIYVGILEIIHGNGIFNLQEVATKILQRRRNCILKRDQIRYCYETILYYAQDLLGKQGIFVHKASFGDKIPGPGEKPGLWTPTDDIVMGSVSLHTLQAKIANLGITSTTESSKTLEEKCSSQDDLVNIKSENNELEKTFPQLPDVVQSPKHVQEKCAISNSNQDNKSGMDMLSDIGSSKGHSRTGSNTSVSSTGSQPQDWAPLQVSDICQTTVSKTLADLQNPSTFTLGTSEPGKKKITKASFYSSKSSLGESNPTDPLSSLDPLWSLHKK
ncbi:hypothetical protein CHS0354_040598 [Potamilus streckersoni]|uniref:Tyrosine-protein phosphatase non-receptor type 23 n=1 Tax=Potamilus streckersoni TaxID=2493646 RepID=A0AAE0SH99_9BIVA|nr:hypothetical protein CHS0354_040598 [Potamilus streckersoni]